jgi:membrane protein implicated in regulation of membrane protease activity
MTLDLLLLSGVYYCAFAVTGAAIKILVSLDSDIAVAITAAGAIVFLSVLSIVLGRAYVARAFGRKELRDKK